MMSRMNNAICGTLTALAALLYMNCGEQVAGGSTETGNATSITANIVYPDSSPAVAASVRLRPREYNPDDAAQKSAVVLYCSVKETDTRVDLGTGTLQSTGTVTGTVMMGGNPAGGSSAFIFGLDHQAPVDETTGQYTLVGIPVGFYVLGIAADAKGRQIFTIGVEVFPDDTTLVDTLNLPDLDAGLVGYWSFDENGGNSAQDLSGNGYHGTVNGAQWVDGHSGSALRFDGSS
jgi:hypothetical protein